MANVLEELAASIFRIVENSFFIFLTTLKMFLNFANKIAINTASWPPIRPIFIGNTTENSRHSFLAFQF
jgi:hypothetical protein